MFYKSVLNEAHIESFIENVGSYDQLEGALNETTPDPSLCIANDDDADEATRLIENSNYTPPPESSEWLCPKCGEKVPGTFGECWKCKESKPVSQPAALQ